MPPTDPHPTQGLEYAHIVRDLAYRYDGVFSRETVQTAVDEARARLEPLATIPTFLPVLTERFARDQLLATAQAEGTIAKATPELLFVCIHNAGRSQMAAAMAKHLSKGRVHVRSAGSDPTSAINPVALQVLAERGMALAEAFPKPLTVDVVRAADVIVTMGCGDECPVFPGRRYLDWVVADPAGEPIDTVRDIADDIEARVSALLAEVLPRS